MEDISYRLKYLSAVNEQHKDSERLNNLLNEYSPYSAMYLKSGDEGVVTLGKFEEYFGHKVRTKKDINQFLGLFDEESKQELSDVFFSVNPKNDNAEYTLKLNSEDKWFRFICHVIRENDNCTEKLFFISDVTDEVISRNNIEKIVYFDELTGLYNRNYFIHLLTQMCEKAEANDEVVSVMIIDMDDFKKVNDGMGIMAGDDLIRQFGKFLGRFNNYNQVIASHFNNDVFAVAVYAPNDRVNIQYLYDEIEKRNSKMYFLQTGQAVEISVTAGVAEYPQASKNPLELVNFAEVIMYKGKVGGKRSLKFFDTASLEKFMYDIEVESILKKAIIDKSFTLFFQPQYEATTKKLRGFEVLCRLFLADGRQIPPGTFIPIAERAGIIGDIGAYVFEEAIRQFADWKDQYLCDFTISINISVIQLETKGFVDFVRNVTDKYGVNPQNIELEITESCFIKDMTDILEKLDVLRECGFKISLDDFGTGYSSFSYLHRLHIDTLKIDKSFVDNIEKDASTRTILKYVNNMVHDLGFLIVAEGVENTEQFSFLKDINCDVIQGFYLGRPVNAATMEEIIKGNR